MADTITIRTDPETLQRLEKLAKATERSRNYLVNHALKAYLDEQAWQIAAIQEGLASLDAGEGIPHDEVMAELRAKIAAARTKA